MNLVQKNALSIKLALAIVMLAYRNASLSTTPAEENHKFMQSCLVDVDYANVDDCRSHIPQLNCM
jgi:hypothetical protein